MAEITPALLEPPPISEIPDFSAQTAQVSAPKGRMGFTPESARAARQAQLEKWEKIKAANFSRIPPPADDSYIEARLYQTRTQIADLCNRMDGEDDAGELAKLTQALERLQCIEADLSGRPQRPRNNAVVSSASLAPARTYANLPPEKRKKAPKAQPTVNPVVPPPNPPDKPV